MAVRKKSKAHSDEPARTIVYIHGIGNKPTENVLRCQWDRALMEFGLGERSRMAYWCQRDRHGPPSPETCHDADAVAVQADRGGRMAARAMQQDDRPLTEWVAEIAANESPADRRTLESLAARISGAPAVPRGRRRGKRVEALGLGDEWNPPDFLTRLVTRLFMVDCRDFFFDRKRRDAMKDSLRLRLSTGGGPFVLVAHSQGTMIAYSLLRELARDDADIALFLTIGSPLGLEEVRDQLAKHGLGADRDRLAIPACVRRWVNVLDEKDPVTQGAELSMLYRGDIGVDDLRVQNPDRARDPHSATGYLSLPVTRQRVRARVDLERFQQVSPFMIAADVLSDHERHEDGVRRPLLIELTDPAWALRRRREAESRGESFKVAAPLDLSLEQMADEVERQILSVTHKAVPKKDLRIQKLRRYLSVHLTRTETERIAQSPQLQHLGLSVPPLYRIWRNAKKVALLEQSIHTVQASAAHRSYEALGHGIDWAVLDSGCTNHPHFEMHRNLAARWDCTRDTDRPVAHGKSMNGHMGNADDRYGHGTHVAGIIAGYLSEPPRDGRPIRAISGIAPRTRLHIYKVLDDDGEGDDAWIIKAIDHVARINEHAGAPVIAGVNLSLGGPYEQGVFGCGFTPLCDELRRLWQQGVVVVLAAGNEGHVRLQSSEGEVEANLAFTIGDPANLDVAIAVGAIHKEKPHTYGVSHFSSRGPTVDGRAKPDCVAPGEQILSCRHDPPKGGREIDRLYYKLDGTSMAAPHVSGLIAAFLSRRREFIGDADRMKRILLDSCTDLRRERQQQGAGMPNLVKMLIQT